MDRRQQKTRQAIFQALNRLLETKRYEAITVQEIIDTANVGRSTFYAHFETKDELLRTMCTELFHHVFTQTLPREAENATVSTATQLEWKLGHVLYHLRENPWNIQGILRGESSELFLSFFKRYVTDLFARYLDAFPADVPEDFLLHHLVGSFAETVKWWIARDMRPEPEVVAAYYRKLTVRPM